LVVYAPSMDDTLRLVAYSGNQMIFLVPAPAEPRPSVRVAARAEAQQTLF